MAGTIVTDRIESDASYASSINIASPVVVSNTINMTGGSFTGNVDIDSGLLFVDGVNNRVGIGTRNPAGNAALYIQSNIGSGTQRPVLQLNTFESTVNTGLDILFTQQGTPVGNIASYFVTGGEAGLSFATYDSTATPALNTRMRIDSRGRITTPFQPCFRAVRTTSYTTNSSNIEVVFQTEVLDQGGYYNPSTGRFTAPVAGSYFFTAHQQPITTGLNSNIMIRVNGSTINYTGSYMTPLPARMEIVTSVVLYLNANDFVSVYAESGSGGTQTWDNQGSFSGFLIG